MLAWGANSHGQLGLGYTAELCDTPQTLLHTPVPVEEIVTMAAGGGHTLLATTAGALYSCGWNNRGQLGLGHSNDASTFQLVGRYDFALLAAGWDTSAGVTRDGALYVWGSNVWQQIASCGSKCISQPQRLVLPNGERVTKVELGLRHTAVLTESGNLWILGKCKWLNQDELEAIEHEAVVWSKLRLGSGIRDIATGENHFVIITIDGRIKCIGDNKFGQCQHGVDAMESSEVTKLQSGWSHSGFLAADGKVRLWGRNNYGQLGVQESNSSEMCVLDVKSRILDFSLGSQHGVVIAVDGVYAWGWNEHGNCGTGGVENVRTPQKLTVPVKVTRVTSGAGFTYAY